LGWQATLGVLVTLVRMYVKAQMEYRGAFWLDRLAQIIAYGSVFTTLWLLVARFENLGGWIWSELALLLSFQLLGYALGAALSFVQLRDLEEAVRLGTFDTLLVKPFSPWAYIVFSGLNIGYLGHIILGVGLLGWSLTQVDIAWSPLAVLYFAASLVSGTMLTAALITMIGATAMIWVRSRHLFSIFFGFWELSRLPLNIFPAGLQIILLTVIPLGFMSYVPMAWLLGKDIPIVGDWGGVAAPLVGPLFVLIAMAHWKYAISKYQGAGG
jgi:ABC-2 type transport system permease protein